MKGFIEELECNISNFALDRIRLEIDNINILREDKVRVKKLIQVLCDDPRKSVQKLANDLQRQIDKYRKEVERVRKLYNFDRSFGNYEYIAGVDEVGRGPLAGPIVAAAVILDCNSLNDDNIILEINDSKKLSPAKREELALVIKEKALSYFIASADSEEIDFKGIAYCNNKIFIEACNGLSKKPELILTDGYPIKGSSARNEYVIKGDTKSASIACASIIAKVYRDNLMAEYAKTYKNYGFERNAGYGTSEHLDSIARYGITPIHRRSFLNNILSKTQ